MHLINYFSKKLHFHTQFGDIIAGNNKKITQSFGFHRRCVQLYSLKFS